MPTLRKSLDFVFKKALPKLNVQGRNLVDLGSGDGRVVIEAARHGYKAVGYELNPILVLVARSWAVVDRKISSWPESGSAKFHCRNFWPANLADADVIVVYGLTPIMKRLGKKIESECNEETIIISNVFKLESINKTFDKLLSEVDVHVYKKGKRRTSVTQ